MVAITDSIMTAGLPDGKYHLRANETAVERGEANLADTGLRAVAYCRVSTRHEKQCHSLEAQIAYYTNFIKRNPNREFVAAYLDIAFGIRTTNRPGYQKLMKDCIKRKADLILVKSLSRFGGMHWKPSGRSENPKEWEAA